MLRHLLSGTLVLLAALPASAQERAVVDVSPPTRLAVTVYRRGAEAVARAIGTLTRRTHVTTLEDPSGPVAGPSDAAAGLASVVP